MKYIILICFLLIGIACSAQLESASPNLAITRAIDSHTVTVINPLGSGQYFQADTAWFCQTDTIPVIILYIDLLRDKDIHWMNGYAVSSFYSEPEYLDKDRQKLKESIIIWVAK